MTSAKLSPSCPLPNSKTFTNDPMMISASMARTDPFGQIQAAVAVFRVKPSANAPSHRRITHQHDGK